MPRILINEVDNTSAGTPGRYGNYSVLIPGFMGTPTTDKKKHQAPDENGVYEFDSAQAFKDTIGVIDTESAHAGNKMAYELLNLGYPVIYKVIDEAEGVKALADEGFWADFKDKASYDFRFVSHGLLKSSYENDEAEARYNVLYGQLNGVNEAIEKLADIEVKAIGRTVADEEVPTLDVEGELETKLQAEFEKVEDYKFVDYVSASGENQDKVYFNSYITAKVGLAEDKTKIEGYIDELDKKSFTVGLFNKVNGNIAKLASYRVDEATGEPFNDGRGDCVALIELDEKAYAVTGSELKPEALIVNGIKRMSASIGEEGAYCALTVPSVEYVGLGKFPGAFHYLACFMGSLSSGFAEWYAAAGYNRGVSSYVINRTSVKLGEIAINALEPRNIKNQATQPPFACNVIANFRGSYYLWGNRTAAKLGSADGGADLTAKHFLNIRQLCTTVKKQLYVACRRFTFDPNSDTLWFNFVNAITPTLDAMKADQGIRDYKIIKEFTDKKATLKAKVRIIPIEAVEDFDITISLEDSFGGVSVTAEG